MTERIYPPEWCSSETMAYLLDMGESTFRDFVSRGLLPPGQKRGGVRRWHRETVVAAFAGLPPVAKFAQTVEHPASDPILEASYGKTAHARRSTPAARSPR
jgi:hypothetical protein